MPTSLPLSACKSYILSQGRYVPQPGQLAVPRPFITISRQTGTGGVMTTAQLTAYLNAHQPPAAPTRWTAFDGELIDRCLDDHHLPAGFAKYLNEDTESAIDEMLDGLFDLHPTRRQMVRRLWATTLHLATLGHCILVGRGAAVVTQRLPQRVSVLLVGSLAHRVAHLMRYDGLSQKAAEAQIAQEDQRRALYVREYFKRDITDPLLYHLVINTDDVPYGQRARLIAELVNLRQAALARAHDGVAAA